MIALPDDDLLRSLLRDRWHLGPAEITPLSRGMLSGTWEFAVGEDPYVCRLVDAAGRQPLEGGLAATEQLRGSGVEAGVPVRTLGGD
jgi:homoserine kinase type II